MSVLSWFGWKKKAKQEPETGSAGETAQSPGAGEESGDAKGPGGCASAPEGGTRTEADAEKSPGCPAEAPAAGVEIPRQQSAGDVEGSEAGEGARQ
ncbi:hypothetical protein [Streptomyces qinzhouensis]|uniref:Uncharacterized protein n=1 Tax=Streptomyces qinzhouensis TaxID=2599401 RepID=A0A5B8JD14_9ACTN|nr:hypothetical protein [Streptomyces qinzhouensis]QDY79377.1 hypothetical protein FQU76_25820 [Streptomyces qinzhouensis]